MVGRRRFSLKILCVLAAIAVAVFLTRDWWLAAMGKALVRDDGPAKADMIVVLAGDDFGHRIEKAAELVRLGYAPLVLVSGPAGFYNSYESDLAIPFIVREGYPESWFVAVRHWAHSTKDEAPILLRELRRRNVHSFLLVTSEYHTRRAAWIFASTERAAGYAPAMRVVAARDEFFRADSWWHSRDAEKIVFGEWTKTLAWWLGI